MKSRYLAAIAAIVFLVFGMASCTWAAGPHRGPQSSGDFAQAMVGLVLAVVVVTVVVFGFLALIVFLFPVRAPEIARISAGKPGLSFLVGLLTAAVFVGLATLAGKVPSLAAIGGILLAVLLAGAIVGLAATVTRLGDGVARMWGKTGASDLARLFMGAACVVLSFVVVFVGWFFLGYVVLQGLGGLVISIFGARPTAPAEV